VSVVFHATLRRSAHVRTTRTVYLVSLNTSRTDAPVQLLSAAPGHASELIWLNETHFAYLNGTALYLYDVSRASAQWDGSAVGGSKPKPILHFPEGVNPTGLQYQRDTGALVFSGQVWADGDFALSGRGDEAWEGRGTSGVVFDELFIRYVVVDLDPLAGWRCAECWHDEWLNAVFVPPFFIVPGLLSAFLLALLQDYSVHR